MEFSRQEYWSGVPLPSLLVNAAAAAANSLQSCPTLCDPIDGSPPGSSVHGIFQARVLEWGAIAFSDISNLLISEISNSTIIVKAMVFPLVMYGCESWTVKKADRQRIDSFELCVEEDS